jgi:hypothetical protein
MLLDAFFEARDELAVQRGAAAGERLELACAVVHPASRPALARVLGVTGEQLDDILAGGHALVARTDGPGFDVLAEQALWDSHPDLDFEACTLADGVASFAPELMLRHVPIDPQRIAVLHGQRLPPPIDDIDALYLDLFTYDKHLRRMQELNAPGILLRNAKARLQQTLDALVDLRSGKPAPDRWEPYSRLMTGSPASALCEAPIAMFADTSSTQTCRPRDCFVLRRGFLVMFDFASVVIGHDGVVLDVFPTCALRPVGSSERHILLVTGGGRASSSGYFSPTPVVRDIAGHGWVIGELPERLPRYVAGTIGDVKWAIVADLQRALGYRISPGWPGDQCGGTTTSVDGLHAYDSGHFVVDAATGRRILDMRFFGLEVQSFGRRPDGAWRFIGVPFESDEEEEEDEHNEDRYAPRLVDEHENPIYALPHPVAALSEDSQTVLCVSTDELVLIDLDSGERRVEIDLRPLAAALALPAAAAQSSALWGNLLATFGVAEHVSRETPETLRAALAAGYLDIDDVTDAELKAAISAAAAHAKISSVDRLPALPR